MHTLVFNIKPEYTAEEAAKAFEHLFGFAPVLIDPEGWIVIQGPDEHAKGHHFAAEAFQHLDYATGHMCHHNPDESPEATVARGKVQKAKVDEKYGKVEALLAQLEKLADEVITEDEAEPYRTYIFCTRTDDARPLLSIFEHFDCPDFIDHGKGVFTIDTEANNWKEVMTRITFEWHAYSDCEPQRCAICALSQVKEGAELSDAVEEQRSLLPIARKAFNRNAPFIH